MSTRRFVPFRRGEPRIPCPWGRASVNLDLGATDTHARSLWQCSPVGGSGGEVLDRNQGHVPGAKREGIPEVLGSYLLRAEIARGELTTIRLAHKQGVLGFQRLFAVK